MGDLAEHFSRSEFACQCGCGFDAVDVELLAVLVDLRKRFRTPVTIISGCRCWSHNAAVDGAAKSLHVFAKAADIQTAGVKPEIVYDYLDWQYGDKYGIGSYISWVHIDVRPDKARWRK